MTSAILSGLFMGLAIISPIGVQNICVIHHGIQKIHINTVILVTIICDVSLIILGFEIYGSVLDVIKKYELYLFILTELYILYLSFSYFMKYLKNNNKEKEVNYCNSKRKTILFIISASVLNPYAIIETFVIIGGIINQQEYKIMVLYGFIIASIIWFLFIGYASFFLSTSFSNLKFSKKIDLISAVSMASISVVLATSYIY